MFAMHHQVPIMNLHNTMRFYTAVWGKRPDSLHQGAVQFTVEGQTFSFQEANIVQSPLSFELAVSESSFWQFFHHAKRWLLQRTGAHCRVVAQAFDLIDPDGHRWHIHVAGTAGQPFDASFCYLEPHFSGLYPMKQ